MNDLIRVRPTIADVPDFAWLTRIHLLASIRDYPADELAEVLDRHGLDAADADVFVAERGRQYDARVLVVTAGERVLGERLTADALPADLAGLMTGREFKVISRREQLAAEAAKTDRRRVPGTPRAARPRAAVPAKPERPAPAICPRCFMQIPAGSKVCESCG